MGRELPPLDYDGAPHGMLLSPDTVLWRVHSATRAPGSFKPARVELSTGRFDCTEEDPYPSLYVAFDKTTALTEVLLRSLPFERRGHRYLPYETIRGRRLTALRVTGELRLVNLISGGGLGAVCQDEWLIHSAEKDFAYTRQWARWLRGVDPAAAGIIWTTRRNLVRRSVVLFGDRAFGLEPADLPAVDLDGPEGHLEVNELLRPFRASVNRPEPMGFE
ncbi:RES family NAD+ phosphorylase [Spongiactinospora sp. TRM90649]|uniref:RES family NAD+ phosphorylase n=1 Tax=Spongiactinospora sp. TRM90649 TaxID=3031114 RepID=UPI0023F8B117|nr:RES family NAD+ phosphorylase [Spongiactinospora sp. TRM90649]MDF5757505.1 RES family NAD+ phosphorylase [Spongiactinospora sp. TRM90649]